MTIGATTKAIKILGKGVTEIRQVPVPELEPGTVLIAVKAVALNPTDWKHVDWFPAVDSTVGCDCAGEIVAIRPEEKTWRIGDRVAAFGHGGDHTDMDAGVFSEYARVSTLPLIRLPDNVTFVEGAAIPLSFHTVVQGLYMEQNGLGLPSPKQPAETPFPVLIYGAATATGLSAVQMARLSGLKVIATCSPKNFELVESMGAHAVFDYRDPELVAKIKEASNNDLHHAFDCIGNTTTIQHCSDSFGPGKGFITHVSVGLDISSVRGDIGTHAVLVYSCIGKPFLFGPELRDLNPYERDLGKNFAEIVTPLLASGKYRPPPIKLLPGGLAGVKAGMDLLRNNEVSGQKLVLNLEDTVTSPKL